MKRCEVSWVGNINPGWEDFASLPATIAMKCSAKIVCQRKIFPRNFRATRGHTHPARRDASRSGRITKEPMNMKQKTKLELYIFAAALSLGAVTLASAQSAAPMP